MCGLQEWPNYQCQLGVARLYMRSAVSHDTFFKMAANTASDSDSSWEESTDESSINPIAEAKRLGANLATPQKAKVARERKIQTNAASKNGNKMTNFKCKQVKKSNFSATLKIKKQLFRNIKTLLWATFWEFIGNLWLSLIMGDRCKWHMRKW